MSCGEEGGGLAIVTKASAARPCCAIRMETLTGGTNTYRAFAAFSSV